MRERVAQRMTRSLFVLPAPEHLDEPRAGGRLTRNGEHRQQRELAWPLSDIRIVNGSAKKGEPSEGNKLEVLCFQCVDMLRTEVRRRVACCLQ